MRRFPVLYEQIAAGEIHLTAVLMLGPHLTEANHVEVLARAKHRTKKEVAALVRQLDPLPDVPARIEPLGPRAPQSSPLSNPSFGEWTASLRGPVRELAPGERPKDWVEARTSDALEVDLGAEQNVGCILDNLNSSGPGEPDFAINPRDSRGSHDHEPQGRVPARDDTPCCALGTQRYKVQFTASQEYVELLAEAHDLLAHSVPNRALDQVHLRALRLLVAELKKRKYALTDRPSSPAPHENESFKPNGRAEARVSSEAERESAEIAVSVTSEAEGEPTEIAVHLADEEAAPELTKQFVSSELAENDKGGAGNGRSGKPRQRGRYVPAAVRRAVAERDRERCGYVDDDGRRCRETSGLELHHLRPHARGGPPTEANLSLRCRAHNALAAEHDFGREFMARKKKTPNGASAPSE